MSLSVPVNYPACAKLDRRVEGSDVDVARFVRTDEVGVTIFEHATPVRDQAGHRDPTAGTDARAMAEWLAERPFLVDTHVVAVRVGGRAGWRVESRLPSTWNSMIMLPPGRKGPVPMPVIRSGMAFARYGPAIGDMTFVDVPGAGVVAIWTWNSFGNFRLATQPAIRAFVAGLRFGP